MDEAAHGDWRHRRTMRALLRRPPHPCGRRADHRSFRCILCVGMAFSGSGDSAALSARRPWGQTNRAPACRHSCACNNDASPIIACSLAKHDYDARISEFRALASRALRDVRRELLSLHLTYDPAFADQVRNLAERERDCCSFLAITVDEDYRGIHLHITAPEEARLAANELFRDFTSATLQPA